MIDDSIFTKLERIDNLVTAAGVFDSTTTSDELLEKSEEGFSSAMNRLQRWL